MYRTLRNSTGRVNQVRAVLCRRIHTTQPVCCTAPTAILEPKKDFYSMGNSRFLSQYFHRAVDQKDPDMRYHDISRGDHDFTSCDYLALAQHPELNRMQGEFIRDNGCIKFNRSGAYPRDTKSLVTQFEAQAAEWLGAAESVMTNSGTEANINILQLLLSGNNMPVYIDKYAHATFVVGARACGRNDMMFFKHNSADEMLKLIKENGPGIVCIDSVYSAMGTVAPIEEMVDICKQHDCILIVDEAHTLGIVGKEGEGLVKSKGLEKDVQFRTTSLGKAFGCGSGLVIFNEETADGKNIINQVSSIPIFSLAPQDYVAARNIQALEIIKKDQWRRDELYEKTAYFRKGAIERGYAGHYVKNSKSNIIPFVVGSVDSAKEMYDLLVKAHIYASPHFYPASPRNKSVVRFTICNFQSYEQIDYVLDVLEEIKPIMKPTQWPDNIGDVSDLGFNI